MHKSCTVTDVVVIRTRLGTIKDMHMCGQLLLFKGIVRVVSKSEISESSIILNITATRAPFGNRYSANKCCIRISLKTNWNFCTSSLRPLHYHCPTIFASYLARAWARARYLLNDSDQVDVNTKPFWKASKKVNAGVSCTSYRHELEDEDKHSNVASLVPLIPCTLIFGTR